MNSFEILRPGDSRYLGAIAVLFIILGLGYSTLTPIFENSDETLHYPYIKYLADGQGLPLAIPNQLWGQEGTQPPLYYAIVAASTFWLDTDNLPEHLQRNPHWLFTEVRTLINDNQNVVLHGPMDTFPYRRAALAIHIGRWWSLFFGLVTVICTFLIARYFFPDNQPLVLTASALTGFTPQFIRVSSTVSNDSLSAALAALTVLLALEFTKPKKWCSKEAKSLFPAHPLFPPVILGLLSGLALLTKLSSLTIFFLASFIIFWRIFFVGETHEQPFQKMIRWILIIMGITVALNGWWFFRNYQLYGEWLAVETHLSLAGGHDSLTLAEVWNLRTEVERAYWATFGWGQIRPPEWIFLILRWFVRIGIFGLALAVLAKLIQGLKSRPLPLNLNDINFEQVIFLLIWAGLNLTLYVRWVMSVGSVSHTRLIFPALTAISILLALGWHSLLPRELGGWFSGLLTTSLLLMNIYSLGWLIYPAFRTNSTTMEISTNGNSLNLTFLNSLKLVSGDVYPGVGLSPAATTQHTISQGDIVAVMVGWKTIGLLDKNYSVAISLLAPDGTVLAQRESYPGLGLRPTQYLKPGDTFSDTYPLKLEGDVQEPIVARAVVTLFDFASETRAGFPALDAEGNEVTPVVGQIKVVPNTWPDYKPTIETEVNFAEAITLVGYDLPTQTSPQTLTLYWKSLTPVDEDYNLFIHLLNAEGNIVAQADTPPNWQFFSHQLVGHRRNNRRCSPLAKSSRCYTCSPWVL